MKMNALFRTISFCTAVILMSLAQTASAAPGLLLAAHGSPSPVWNKPVLDFAQKVGERILKDGKYKAVRVGLMESAKPDIPTAVAELEAAGCDRIVVVPLFLMPTGHTHFDLPAILGIYASPATDATMKAEKAAAARPKVPIELLQTMADSDVLDRYAVDEVRKLSKSPGDEAVVLLVHGDPEHALLVERAMRRITTYCCGQSGIGYGDWASIGVGQEYATAGRAAIETALRQKRRAIVVGLYLSTTAAAIDARAQKTASPHAKAAAHTAPASPLPADRVVFSQTPLIAHPALFDWVIQTAEKAAD